jgi:small subunit ribosomal protein S20
MSIHISEVPLANSQSAKKRMRQNARRRTRNQAIRSRMRSYLKLARASARQGKENAALDVTTAISALDRAVARGVIHRNNAARRKSRLMKALAGAKK